MEKTYYSEGTLTPRISPDIGAIRNSYDLLFRMIGGNHIWLLLLSPLSVTYSILFPMKPPPIVEDCDTTVPSTTIGLLVRTTKRVYESFSVGKRKEYETTTNNNANATPPKTLGKTLSVLYTIPDFSDRLYLILKITIKAENKASERNTTTVANKWNRQDKPKSVKRSNTTGRIIPMGNRILTILSAEIILIIHHYLHLFVLCLLPYQGLVPKPQWVKYY